jgi:mercuric ion transport protein
MSSSDVTMPHCCCCDEAQDSIVEKVEKPTSTTAKATVKTASSMLLSVLIAFFPKCPFCWAAYMSMFGSFGLAKVPYMSWLFPVLLVFLALHLYFLFKKVPQKGYGPFLISVFGGLVLLAGRKFFPHEDGILFLGMISILGGSLWNSFSLPNIKFSSFSLFSLNLKM